MSDSQANRAQLRAEIQKTSRDEYILSEMKKLGFWKEEEEMPSLPEQLIKQEGELARELNELLKKQRQFENKEALLRQIRKERMKASREKQKETKRLREEKRLAKAKAWEETKKKEIIYLGEGVSHQLNQREHQTTLLQKNNLPAFQNIEALAQAMDTSVNALRFLAYTRDVSETSHYQRFSIPKKTGGTRAISAPMPRLKKAQNWLLENLLYKVPIHEAAHGFVPKKSIVTNAQLHVGQETVINLDLKNFFPTFDYRRVKGLFKSLGYSPQMATLFALLCTEPDMDEVELDGKTYFVTKGERFLPQGAPTSPAITNIMCRQLDRRMAGLAQKMGVVYSRYADDMTFSGSGLSNKTIQQLLWAVQQIVKDEDLTIHPDKTRVMRNGARKEVTGIVVNEKLGIERKKVDKFKAVLHQIEKNGTKGKTWGDSPNLLAGIHGYRHFLNMVDANRYKDLIDQAGYILRKHGYYRKSKPTQTTDKPWWKFWE